MKRLVVLIAVVALGAAGCSTGSAGIPSASPTSSSAASSAGPVNVVASTNVYGDIVKAIGGPAVSVSSIIDSPDKDPHEYQADARTQLATVALPDSVLDALERARCVLGEEAGLVG